MRARLVLACVLLLAVSACERSGAPDLGERIAVGYVLDSVTNAPVAGAVIRFEDPASGVRAMTDERGEFRIALPPLGTGRSPRGSADQVWPCFAIRVEAEGYLSMRADIQDEIPRQVRAGPAVSLEPVPPVAGNLRGRVSHPSGEPAVRVPVVVELGYPASPIEVVTDEDGRFGPVAVPAGYRWIEAAPEACPTGRRLVFVPPKPEGEIRVEVPLPRLGAITGIVRDETGRPVAGARVSGLRTAGATETGADGRFRLPVVAGGWTNPKVEKEDYSYGTSLHFRDGEEIALRVHRRRWIEGVLHLPDGSPAGAGFLVVERAEGGLTKRDGSFSVEVLSGGRRTLRVSRDDAPLGQFEVDVPAGDFRFRHDLRLSTPGETAGVVLDDLTSDPLAGVLVEPFGSVTDRAGRFRVAWPREWTREEFRVSFSRRGYESLRLDPRVEGMPDPVRLTPRARVRVRAVDPEGRPVRGAFLFPMFVAYLCDPPESIWTDEDGHATVACSAEFARGFVLVHSTLGRAEFDVPDLGPGDRFEGGEQVLEPEPVWDPLVLQVTDEKGNPLTTAYAGGRGFSGRLTSADEEGRLEFPGLPGLVTAPGREAIFFSDLADPGPGPIVLRESAPIRGTVQDLRGHAIPGAGVRLFPAHDIVDVSKPRRGSHEILTDALGRFEVRGTLPGEAVRLMIFEKEFDARGGDSDLVIRIARPQR